MQYRMVCNDLINNKYHTHAYKHIEINDCHIHTYTIYAWQLPKCVEYTETNL